MEMKTLAAFEKLSALPDVAIVELSFEEDDREFDSIDGGMGTKLAHVFDCSDCRFIVSFHIDYIGTGRVQLTIASTKRGLEHKSKTIIVAPLHPRTISGGPKITVGPFPARDDEKFFIALEKRSF